MVLRSFGCSFFDGTELPSIDHTWPGILSKNLGIPFKSYAQGGAGNLKILDDILKYASSNNGFYIVNWTWIDRFDFCPSDTEKWQTLRPSLDHPHGSFYFRNLHGQYTDMLQSLIYIRTAIEHLTKINAPFIMTYMDDLLFSHVWDSWQDPRGILRLQNFVKPHLKSFDGDTFLDWSKRQNFKISPTLHPLEQAHQAAADYWLPHAKELL